MDVKRLREIIREEVQEAIRSELREILTEAVEIASRPSGDNTTEVTEELSTGFSGLDSILQETRKGMTREDYKNVLGEGLETPAAAATSELPSFISRAKAIFDAANLKDKERHAV